MEQGADILKSRHFLFCESSPGYGGQEDQILGTMKALEGTGNTCILACRSGSKIAEEAEKRRLTWTSLSFRNFLDVGSIWKIWKILVREKIDVAFGHSGHDSNILRTASLLCRTPLILIRVRTYLPGQARARSFRGFDRVLVPSKFLRSEILTNPAIQACDVDVLPPLLDIGKLRAQAACALPVEIEEFLQNHSPVILHAAMLRPEKGQKMALSMVSRLREKFPQIGYILAGSGSDETKLRAHAAKLGISDHVLFAGFVSPISALIARADLLIMPSLREPLGLAQLEAMALGVPVAVSDVGGLPETVEDGVTGWILASGDLNVWLSGVDEILSSARESKKRAAQGVITMNASYSVAQYLQNIESQILLAGAAARMN